MSLDLINSDKLDEDFASFTLVNRGNIKRNRPHPRVDLIPTELPSGDRLEDSFGGSANYRPVSEMNSFEYGGAVPDIASVGDTDYESTPYGYTLNEEYSNFRILGIGKLSSKQKARREAFKRKRKEAKEERKKMSFGNRFINIFQKYNPAVAVPRSSALVGLRVNIFGIATKLYPALLTQEELVKRKFDLENAKKAKIAYDKVNKFWLSMGGSSVTLNDAIKQAYHRPIFKTKASQKRKAHEKSVSFDAISEDEILDTFSSIINGDEQYSNFDPYSDLAIGMYISLGLSLLGMVSNMITKSGAKKNPYAEGSPESKKLDDQLKTAVTEAPPVTEKQVEELKKLEGLAKEDLNKGLGLDESTGALESKKTILGMPKPVFWIGVGVIAIVGGYFAYKKFIKK